jgi:hypothetical protein
MDPVSRPAADLSVGDLAMAPAPDLAPTADMVMPEPERYLYMQSIGAYNRMTIIKSNPARNLCINLTVYDGDPNPRFMVSVSDKWYSVEGATIESIPGGCPKASPLVFRNRAIGGSGVVNIVPNGSTYCPVDFDVIVDFPTGLPGLPARERLQGSFDSSCN